LIAKLMDEWRIPGWWSAPRWRRAASRPTQAGQGL